MANPEAKMRAKLVAQFKNLHFKPVENRVATGMPDISYAGGQMELKYLPGWPVKHGIVRFHRYTNGQRIWLKQHWECGGRSFLTIQAGQEWVLIAGPDAWPAGLVDVADLLGLAILHTRNWDPEQFRYVVTAPLPELEHLRSIKCTQTHALNLMKSCISTARESD